MTETQISDDSQPRRSPILLPAVLALVGLLALVIGAWYVLSAPGRHEQRFDEALAGDAPVYQYEVVATHDHDTGHFTEGLVVVDGLIYEGTGRTGQSVLEVRHFPGDEVRQRVELDDELFGEGVTVLGDRIYQLTYKAGEAFVYDRQTLERIETFQYDGEGWGLTNDGESLIMSNGTSTLTYRDPETFEVLREVEVHDESGTVSHLNELEWVDGLIYANVFPQDVIAVIDPEDGRVTAWLDLGDLHPEQADSESVLNGIATLPNGRLLVTGKNWDRMYELDVQAAE